MIIEEIRIENSVKMLLNHEEVKVPIYIRPKSGYALKECIDAIRFEADKILQSEIQVVMARRMGQMNLIIRKVG